MNILAVDDEELILWKMEKELRQTFPSAKIYTCSSAAQVYSFLESNELEEHRLDYAFLDVELGNYSGIDVAKNIRKVHPECRYIFCTAFSEYTFEAYEVHAIGYLAKPVTEADIRNHFRLIGIEIDKGRDVSVRTFGNFDVFVDGIVINFRRSKAKELLAYLVDRRGSMVTTAEAYNVLWDDNGYTSLAKDKVQHVKKDLKAILDQHGIGEILVCKWNGIAVDNSKLDCDYYRFMEGDQEAISNYNGEYMTQYSWSVYVTNLLEKKLKTN